MNVSKARHVVALVVSITLWSWCAPLLAADPVGVKLLRPDSLAGWEYGEKAPANWIISQGRLTGNSLSTPLLSGWSLGDFELRLEWSVTDGGAWDISFPQVPTGEGWHLTLKDGEGCGALREQDKKILPGATVEALPNGAMHTAVIRRSGPLFSVIVDGRVLGETTLDAHRRFGLALAVPSGEATLNELRLIEPSGNPLFNGKDLTGWFVNNGKGEWAVDKGDIIPTGHRGLHYLRTDREYANFTLSLEYTISRGGNSGLAIRTAKDGWPSGDGMELQILDQPGEVKDSTMAIYGNLPPLDRADKSEQWNRVVVKADGRMISAWVNGELVQQVNTARLPEVKHRHLQGWIGLQDHGGKVRFHDINLLEAPEGMGLDAWYRPVPETGPALVLDRVMNTARLARADGIRAGVVARSLPKGGEHVLAELTGPGALVRVWRSYAAGRLAFYFDGEETPRIECAAEHLAHSVPEVAHQEQPLLTCLAYAKSLKIVATDPLPADYRLDYVTFPPDVPVESYTVKRSGIPRGMLPAIDYRHEGLGGGKLREAEIYERVDTEPRTIEPGTTVELASLPGAGTVNWIKLRADRGVLANNDLWIEVTVDGETLPAIVAPARFLFPALASSSEVKDKDFDTMVLTAREGFASLLAMPYGAGLTVAARNRGSKPIPAVAISMSVDRANDANREEHAGRMRLRGVYQPAGNAKPLLRQTGSGRWVAWIYEQPAEGTTGLAALRVDGQPRDGWAMSELDPFWGRPGEGRNFYRALSGRRDNLAWRYLLLEAPNFDRSLELDANPGDQLGSRLALFYLAP